MRAILSILLLAAAPAAPAASAPPRFDLDCSGGRAWAIGGESEKIAAHYRVDTVAGKWCRDECAVANPIASSRDAEIVFKQQEAGPASRDKFSETVDLSTGAWLDLFEGEYPPGDYWRSEGVCRIAPFTPLP